MLAEPSYYVVLFDVYDPKKFNSHRFKRIDKSDYVLLHDPLITSLGEPECEIVDKRSFYVNTTTTLSYFMELTVKYTNDGM